MSNIFCLMGPTATGKTDLAIKLLSEFPFELISVDSAMVYRGMDIGTAKPDKNSFHHLIDICHPRETYSVGRFCEDAVQAIQDIEKKNKIPLLVGGTMLYFRGLQQGLSALPQTDTATRKKIAAEIIEKGLEKMYQQLQHIDPISAKKLHPNDAQRIARALEVYAMTGVPLSVYHEQQRPFLPHHRFINIVLMPHDREKLKEKIIRRFIEMLHQGLIEEVNALMDYAELPCMRSVGYHEVSRYLLGEYNKETMIEKAVIATCQLAKRQMTWLRNTRHFGEVVFLDSDSPTVYKNISQFIQSQIFL